jgi:sec-independent protein translocase protein TatB
MLPEIGATELMVIAAVALIVVGPKDLPVLLRKLGQFVSRLRGMANDFRSSFDEMARQSELDELRKEVAAMRAGQIAPADDGQVSQVFDDIDMSLKDRSWDPATYEPTPTYESTPTYDPIPEGDYVSPDTPAEKPKRARKPKPAPAEAAPAKTPARKAAAKTGKSKA